MNTTPLLLEERVAALEEEMRKLKKCLDVLSNNLINDEEKSNAPSISNPISPITVVLIRKAHRTANLLAGDAGDQIQLSLRFYSTYAKSVRGFKGGVVFKDLFGEVILNVSLTCEEALPAGDSIVWEGGILFNQFLPAHQRLLSIKQSDLEISFIPAMVLFTDGTRDTLGNRE